MRTVRLPLLRGALFIIALAAIAFILARGDNPAAEATSFEPFSSVSVSDSNPGANADLIIDFSLDAPDAFPNITNKPAIQFIPRQWQIHVPETEEEMAARIGGIAGTFNVLTYIGLFGTGPCANPTPVNFTMADSTPDTGYDPATGTYDPQKLASSLDLGGDSHPFGAGFSGQFVDDPNFATYPSDHGLPLVRFKANDANEMWGNPNPWEWGYTDRTNVYRDVDGSGSVSATDVRLHLSPTFASASPSLGPGTVVAAGDPDIGWVLRAFTQWSSQKHDDTIAANGQMDPGEHVYYDTGGIGRDIVSDGDQRLFVFEGQPFGSYVEVSALTGGVTRYPDFLNLMFPPEALGNPLARQFGQSRVAWNPVSLNLVTFRPGQLPGYPASLGFPTVVVVLNPLELGADPVFMSMTADLCTPLSLTSTNFGISRDNPETPLVNETGHARLTNPKSEKDHVFTLAVESQPDADDDGVENLLDACPLDFNLTDDSRDDNGIPYLNPRNPDGDGIDGACDPLQYPPADWGAALIPFNTSDPKEMCGPPPGWGSAYCGFGGFSSTIYRDNDNSGNVTPGDDRLYHQGGLAPGVVQDSDSDYRNPATGQVRPYWARRLAPFRPDIKHDESVAVNGWYDPGENVYSDRDGSGDVGHNDDFADFRMLFEGLLYSFGGPGVEVGYIGTSVATWPAADEDLDNYADRGDNCAVVPNGVEVLGAEAITLRAVDFYLVERGGLIGPDEQADTDGDSIGDACEGAEHGDQCLNAIDDDGDGAVNDGCPTDHPNGSWTTSSRPSFGFGEGVMYGGDFGWCQDDIDNDGDGAVNDGCPNAPRPDFAGAEGGGGPACNNAVDDDGDGLVNDGCPMVRTGGTPETGAQCDNAGDDDNDGRPNDGCPTVDPGDAAKMTPDGHVHQFRIERTVTIKRHGVKLDDLDGPERVTLDGSGRYMVALENKSSSDEEAQVALRVVEGCGAVSGPSSVHMNGDGSANADFTVDFSGCAAGEYTVQADACHAGDAAPNGFFGAGACPGASDVPGVPAQLSPSGATASSEAFGPEFSAAMAIDNDTSTLWCTGFEPGVNIQASFASPVSIDQVNIEDSYGAFGYAFVTGTLSFSNGYSQDVTLSAGAGSFSMPLQSGVEWVRFTATAAAADGIGCISELKISGLGPAVGDTNLLDDAPMAMTVKVGRP